jgi:hypothetical protein
MKMNEGLARQVICSWKDLQLRFGYKGSLFLSLLLFASLSLFFFFPSTMAPQRLAFIQ